MAKQPMNNKQYDGSEFRGPGFVSEGTVMSEGTIVNTEPASEMPTPKVENKPMKKSYDIKVKVVNSSNHVLPTYATPTDAGLDLRANLESPVVLPAHGRMLIGTGLKIAVPEGYECQVRPRSGLALKHGITVLNTPGTVDSDFTGDIGIILFNTSDKPFTVNPGDKIAQGILSRVYQMNFIEVESLEETERGSGGYGHSGIK